MKNPTKRPESKSSANRLTESERQALVDEWDDTIAGNPRYGGLTIKEATRRILLSGKPGKPKPNSEDNFT